MNRVAIVTGASRGALVLWLCSDQARFITGTTIPIEGGALAGVA